MTEKELITEFNNCKKLAIAGVSRNKNKFGYHIFRDLQKKGIEVLPINPNTNEIDGVKSYKSPEELPDEIELLHTVTSKERTLEIIKSAHKKGINKIWIQQSSETPEAIEFCIENKIDFIHKKCIYMFIEPVSGMHKFHRFLRNIFAKEKY